MVKKKRLVEVPISENDPAPDGPPPGMLLPSVPCHNTNQFLCPNSLRKHCHDIPSTRRPSPCHALSILFTPKWPTMPLGHRPPPSSRPLTPPMLYTTTGEGAPPSADPPSTGDGNEVVFYNDGNLMPPPSSHDSDRGGAQAGLRAHPPAGAWGGDTGDGTREGTPDTPGGVVFFNDGVLMDAPVTGGVWDDPPPVHLSIGGSQSLLDGLGDSDKDTMTGDSSPPPATPSTPQSLARGATPLRSNEMKQLKRLETARRKINQLQVRPFPSNSTLSLIWI
jgi:hypothetical protein